MFSLSSCTSVLIILSKFNITRINEYFIFYKALETIAEDSPEKPVSILDYLVDKYIGRQCRRNEKTVEINLQIWKLRGK